MRKLEDIPKKSVFKVPDGYFDQLPSQVQARMAAEPRRSPITGVVGFSLKFALPVVALVVVGLLWLRPTPSIESQLEEIDVDQIAVYLENTERIDLDDAQDSDWTRTELDELEDTIYSNMESTEDLLNDIDLENL